MKALFKKISVIVLSLMVVCITCATSAFADGFSESNEQNESTRSADLTCGKSVSGSFGTMPSTVQYTVYLRGNKQIAFAGYGPSIITYSVYDPSGNYIGSINRCTASSSSLYGVLTTNQAGNYTIRIYGACGAYEINCLTGIGTTTYTNTGYTRLYAANYATSFYNTYNPAYGPTLTHDSVNFVSQCLFAGGMPEIANGTGNARLYWYHVGSDAGDYSITWKDADYFMQHWSLVRLSGYNGRAYSTKIYTRDYILTHGDNFFNDVGIGDVILYLQWTNGDKYSDAYHAAIITNKVINSGNKEVMFKTHSSVMNSGTVSAYLNDEVGIDEWIVVLRISSN